MIFRRLKLFIGFRNKLLINISNIESKSFSRPQNLLSILKNHVIFGNLEVIDLEGPNFDHNYALSAQMVALEGIVLKN